MHTVIRSSTHNTAFLEIGKMLSLEYDSYPIPNAAPKFLIWLVGPFVDKNLTRRYIRDNVNHKWKTDISKFVKELQIRYRPLKEIVSDFFPADYWS